jgi:hypothetical protein
LTDDSTQTASHNVNRSPDYDAAFREAGGMSREEVMLRAREVFDHTNHVRATRTGADCFGVRAAAIEAALAWANICRYMDITRADSFAMGSYRPRAVRPSRGLPRYLRRFGPRARKWKAWAVRLGDGTEPVTFYEFREDRPGRGR